jgi:hypothetical protein
MGQKRVQNCARDQFLGTDPGPARHPLCGGWSGEDCTYNHLGIFRLVDHRIKRTGLTPTVSDLPVQMARVGEDR